MRQFPSQIFRSREREIHQYAGYNAAQVFNVHEGENSFQSLTAFKEMALQPRQFVEFNSNNEAFIVIPLVGALEYQDGHDKTKTAVPGETVCFSFSQTHLKFCNPYDKESVIFLVVSFSQESFTERTETDAIELDVRNKLHAFVSGLKQVNGYIGIYDGRKEEFYQLQNPQNTLLLFVISGAFEVSGRLLEERDVLSVWDCEEIDIEALSENAVILLIEVCKAS